MLLSVNSDGYGKLTICRSCSVENNHELPAIVLLIYCRVNPPNLPILKILAGEIPRLMLLIFKLHW
jgi:hypothetical protein